MPPRPTGRGLAIPVEECHFVVEDGETLPDIELQEVVTVDFSRWSQ